MNSQPPTIERVEIGSLQPDPANLRKHPERNLAAITASLKRFGQQRPILTDHEGVIRCGNGTWQAARRLGWTHIDRIVTDLKGAELAAFAIADNRTGELAEWAAELDGFLATLKVDLPDLDLDVLGLGSLASTVATPGALGLDPVVSPAEPARQAPEASQPVTEPVIGSTRVTTEDVSAAADGLEHATDRTRRQIEVMCPKCGEEFLIDG